MARYVCNYCSHVYDEEEGDPDSGIAPGTIWAKVPDDWGCPDCGQPKSAYYLED